MPIAPATASIVGAEPAAVPERLGLDVVESHVTLPPTRLAVEARGFVRRIAELAAGVDPATRTGLYVWTS